MRQTVSLHTRQRVGYRLDYAEVFNWGTFTNSVYRIAPEGGTTLLTGANGSGKTTFIEALMTLLVPDKRMRFYNQASGTNQRNERTEESYVLGVYGNTIDEQNTRQTERLREKDTYSVLLAVFSNENQSVTLAQVRWFSGGELKRSYVLAHLPLTIADDFSLGERGTDWKKSLRQKYPRTGNRDLIDFFDGPGQYANAFQRVFGMRSPKALTLFSQTVGLKVLGDLNEFVRTNMLEETDMEDEFMRLKDNVDKLIRAHTELEKIEEQINRLEPIRTETELFHTARQAHSQFSNLQQIRPAFVAQHKVTLCAEAADAQRRLAAQCETDRQTIETELTALREQVGTLDFAIRTDTVGEQLRELKKQADEAARDWNNREANAERYDTLSRKIGLTKSVERASFEKRRTYLTQRQQTLEQEREGIERDRFSAEEQLKTAKAHYEATAHDLQEARQQQNNIPMQQRRIREALVGHLNTTEAELPFVGELLDVRPEERAIWQRPIEKLLHSFALCLLVPEELYKAVNAYVNDNDLKGRLVFFRVDLRRNYGSTQRLHQPDSVRNKLTINGVDAGESEYGPWLEQQLEQRYDYRCVDNLDDFRNSSKALTKEGFIKNENRHEKDDSREGRQGQAFVLGWDNKALIRHYESTLMQLDGQIKETQSELTVLRSKLKEQKEEGQTISDLLRFDTYADIDWQTKAAEALDLQRRQQALEDSNDQVRELKQQLATVQQAIGATDERRSSLEKKQGSHTGKAEGYEQKQQEAVQVLSLFTHVNAPDLWESFEQYATGQKMATWTAETVDADERKLTELLTKQEREAKDLLNTQERKLEKLLRDFKEPTDALRQRFPNWLADTNALGSDVAYAPEYIELLERLKRQELGKQRKRFRQLLNENIINGMADFSERLFGNVNKYKDNIDALNQSLQTITYTPNPKTFIQLDYQDDWSVKVRDFKQKLSGWMPNLTEYERTRDERILEASFRKIKSLIEELDQNKEYRREVTDVRNWLRFRAIEYRADAPTKPYRLYETTGSLSGGEKAQLTYTILGSAIAYQFGIGDSNTPDSRSFRFICIDESFSNQDDVKASFLLDLCQQLQLQLLVVTPNDKTHIVEPYISAVHLVQRRNNLSGRPSDSVLYNLTIGEYEQRKSEPLLKLSA